MKTKDICPDEMMFIKELKKASRFDKEQLLKLITIIENFMHLFGPLEFVKFHNDFMLPLLKRTRLKNEKRIN